MAEEIIKISGRLRVVLLILSSVALLGGSISVWFFINRSVEEQRSREFSSIVDITKERALDTVDGIVERLYDMRGLVTNTQVNDDVWRNYFLSSDVESRYPGVFTFAYAPRVLRSDLQGFIEETRIDEKETEYRKYSVFPETTNGELFPIKFLVSSDIDLKSLLGYDIGTSETQSRAIATAVAEDSPVITDLLHIGLVIPNNQKTGYVIMLPVYSKTNITDYPKSERKQFFIGLVGTWIFPQGLVSYIDIEGQLISKSVSITVYDGENKLFSVGKIDGDLKESSEIQILNKTFRVDFSGSKQKVLSPLTESLPLITLITLIILNAMWGSTVGAIMLGRRQAVRLAEEATKDLRKFKQAVEGVSDLVVITDKEGVIIYVNKAAEKITGYSREKLLGNNTSLWGGQMDEGFYKKFWKTIKEEKKPFWGEVTNKRKSGELYQAEIQVSPILDESGNLIFFVGIERDMSKAKAVERMKTEFISLASHQLRTPLSAVKWFGKMLISGDAGKLSNKQKDYIQKIYESNEKEIKLVNSLLNVSKIEAGKIVVKPSPTNLVNVIANVITDYKVESENNGRKISVVIKKPIPIINVDEDLIRLVFSNLMSNALRYTKKGGRVVVKTFVSKSNVITEVKDDGIGIPINEQKRIFEKFFRASNALKKETEGNGLGLYLSKAIIESSRGKIGFRSSLGKGSLFWFSLPIKNTARQRKML